MYITGRSEARHPASKIQTYANQFSIKSSQCKQEKQTVAQECNSGSLTFTVFIAKVSQRGGSLLTSSLLFYSTPLHILSFALNSQFSFIISFYCYHLGVAEHMSLESMPL